MNIATLTAGTRDMYAYSDGDSPSSVHSFVTWVATGSGLDFTASAMRDLSTRMDRVGNNWSHKYHSCSRSYYSRRKTHPPRTKSSATFWELI